MIAPALLASEWNVLRFSGQTSMVSPGVVALSGDGLKLGWDIQNATGTSGAVTRRTGDPLREFDAEFSLSDDIDADGTTDFDRWDDFQAFLRAMVSQGKTPFARDVSHPDLARCEITSVTLGSIGMMQLDGKGGGKIKVHFLEFKPPKPLTSTPATKTEGDKKIDDVLAKIDKAQADYDKL